MGVIFKNGEADGILKAMQDARDIIERQQSDLRQLAEAVLEAHKLVHIGNENWKKYATESCPACQIARRIMEVGE